MRTTPCIVLTAIVVLGCGLVRPALAQTGRIAHLSHGGSLETLAAHEEIMDNFGGHPSSQTNASSLLRNPPSGAFAYDSIQLTSDSTALEYGTWSVGYHNPEKVRKRRFVLKATKEDKREMMRYFRKYHPEVKLLGFDTTDVPDKPKPRVKANRKEGHKKSAALINVSNFPPPQSGILVTAALIVGLGSLGWLLGEKRESAKC